MSILTYDFHFVCVNCRSVDCDFDFRYDECADIADDFMTNYVKHKRSLMSKQQSKDPLLSASAVDDPVIVSVPPSSIDLPPVSLDPPLVSEDIESKVSAKFSIVKNEMTDHFRSFFDEFSKSLEVKFSSRNQKLSQVVIFQP